jgi:hypothetical protein
LSPTSISFAEQPYPECGELRPVVLASVTGDLDGDTGADSVVGVRCETVTAGAPILVVAFLLDEATGGIADRAVLVTQCGAAGGAPCTPGVADQHLVGDLQLEIVDGIVEVGGRAYSDDAPLCCPDLDVALAFAWTGETFDQVPRGR